MHITRATAKDGRTFHRTEGGDFQVAPAVKALASPPAKKSTTAYAAALVTRLSEDWPITILSADAANRWSLRQLRARARDLERNGGIHSAYLSALEANIIGSKGIGVQMKVPMKRATLGADSLEGRIARAKPAKARVITDPAEADFLQSIKADAETMLAGPRRARRALWREKDTAWKSAVTRAVWSLKAGEEIYTEDPSGLAFACGELDRFACYTVEKEWKAFSKRGNCDVTGKHSMMDFCRLTLRTTARDGDAVILVYFGYPNRWGLAFQLIEGDYVDDYYNVERLPNGNSVRMGVEIDRFRRKVALWVFAQHPGDYGVEGVNGYGPQRRRIAILGEPPDPYFTDGKPESVQAIHVTKSKRAEETRAVPWITPAMQLIHHIETYKEAEITAARTEACKHEVLERDTHTPDGQELDWDSVQGRLTEEMQPGAREVLPPGYRAKLIDPNHPNPNMPQFLKAMKREVAMALNYCYNTLFGDLESVNYSSIRAGTLNEREASKMDQAWFGDDVFTPIFETFLKMSIVAGALPFRVSDFERINAYELKFRRWPWVDPHNDAQTAVLLIENKLRTRAQVIADMSSDDFEETIDELDYEAGYIAEKENLQPTPPPGAAPALPPPASDPEDAPDDEEEETEPTGAIRGAIKSAFLGDAAVSDFPAETQAAIARFCPHAPEHLVLRYGMTVPELLAKADQKNLETARHHLRNAGVAASADEVHSRTDKHIFILNDRIVDGHHFLAKAEKGKVTSSLSVIDLTPLRYQAAPVVKGNPNHDPSNGQFSAGGGGANIRLTPDHGGATGGGAAAPKPERSKFTGKKGRTYRTSAELASHVAAHPGSVEHRVLTQWVQDESCAAMNANPAGRDARALRAVLAKVEPYKSPEPLHRGLSFDSNEEVQSFVMKLESGPFSIADRCAMSATKDASAAVKYASRRKHGVLLQLIDHYSGRDIDTLSGVIPEYRKEKEVVFTREASFAKVGQQTVTVGGRSFTKLILSQK